MTDTTFEQFAALAARGTVVPVCREVRADMLTPVSAFLRIAENTEHAFLLESVEGGERTARYSFLGKDPFLILRSGAGGTRVERGSQSEQRTEPFLDTLRELMSHYRSAWVPGLPRFTGGAVGFLGYDAAAWFEPTLGRHPSFAEKPRGGDDAGFMFFDTVLAFDHVKHRILIIANARVDGTEAGAADTGAADTGAADTGAAETGAADTGALDAGALEVAYALARAKIRFLEGELRRQLSEPDPAAAGGLEVRSNTTQAEFEKAVRTAKAHITAGDIFQVVLSQRFETEVAADPFAVYRALRYVNPSPYMYFIRMGGVAIVGSSPEMLVRVEGRRAETHAIAGTRPRGETDEADQRLAAELAANEKERAEHVMLVDLGRNDLGRVSEYGSVHVPEYMALARYSHVMHLVSRIEGTLTDGQDRLDALAACFPAGTVSGAPKIRAMEIIADLEPTRRGIYAGAVGYLDFAGHLDCCIAIRTIVMTGGRAYVQAGAGIVADSDPTAEYRETEAKASALIRALEIAQRGDGPATT